MLSSTVLARAVQLGPTHRDNKTVSQRIHLVTVHDVLRTTDALTAANPPVTQIHDISSNRLLRNFNATQLSTSAPFAVISCIALPVIVSQPHQDNKTRIERGQLLDLPIGSSHAAQTSSYTRLATAVIMAASDAMIDPAIADSGVSYSPHHNHEHDVVNVDGKDDGASVASDTEEIFAPNPAASYAASAAAYAASAAATAVAATQSASPAPAPAPTAQMAMAQAHVPSPSPGPPPAQTPASPVSTASAAAAAAAAAAAVAAAAATPMARVQQYNPVAHGHLVLYLAALHGSRITADNLAGSFAPPLNHEKLLDWWRVRLTTSAVFLLLRTPYESSTAPGGAGAGGAAAAAKKVQGTDLVGVIMLRSHPAETSPHVATVDLLLVNLQYRQLGGERQLLQTVERQALREGRTLLTAEAESKSSMANMYTTLGFTEAGQIPGMVLRPATGEKRSLSIFYKDLEQAAAAQAAAQSVASSSRQSPVAQS